MKKLITLLLFLLPHPSSAGQPVALPDDKWQPLTLIQAESVCVYKEVKRPGLSNKYRDNSKKTRKECIEKTRKYGLVGKDFIGLVGHYREQRVVRARQLDQERQSSKKQLTDSTIQATVQKNSAEAIAPSDVSDIIRRIDELEHRVKLLENDNIRLRQQIEMLKSGST